MKYKLKELLEIVDEEDLYKLKADLSKGGIHIRKLVEQKIMEREALKRKYCTNCGELLAANTYNWTLIFGPEDFKKKASFCGIDCMNYFLKNISEIFRRQAYSVESVKDVSCDKDNMEV